MLNVNKKLMNKLFLMALAYCATSSMQITAMVNLKYTPYANYKLLTDRNLNPTTIPVPDPNIT